MMRLDVWLTLPDGSTIQAGELAFTDADQQGRYVSAFRYTADYLADQRAFPLDPSGLPLIADEFQSQQLGPPLMVFEDALPDIWGRRLLILRNRLPRGQQSEPYLLQAMAGRGLGALGFHPPGQPSHQDDASAGMLELDELEEAAQRLDEGGEVDDSFRILMAAGSSPGGARPKALVKDAAVYWLAKFSSRRDDADVVGLEAASLELARLAGLVMPEFRLTPLAGGRRALLVRRFDLTVQGGRRHMLSMRALLQASGYYVLGYADMIKALRQYGTQPEIDVPRLYRLMVFNALIGNTDDHLKNFWLMHDERGYTLSPAFDLLPDVGGMREHVLMFDLSPHPPGPSGLIALGKRWGVSGSAAVLEEVRSAVTHFAEIADKYAVPKNEIDRFAKDIARRLTNPN
jgi:serine/threonine-protein kinase HipA